MNEIQKKLFEYKDEKYAKFQQTLIPGSDESLFIGVRVPNVRKIAKEVVTNNQDKDFLDKLPHKYYDENLLHSVILSQRKDYEECLKRLDAFLPYVDNWAVCDTLKPNCFKKHKKELLPEIKKWISSKHTYTCRFGVDMLMTFYLDEDFKAEYLKLPSKIHSKEYYVNMMIAWYYATALAKQWNDTIVYLENNKLDTWVHNKTIQKAIESYRITQDEKEYLRSLRRQ